MDADIVAVRLDRLEAAARRVLADWHATRASAGKVIHTCSDRAFSEGECDCIADPPAVAWRSLSDLEDCLTPEGIANVRLRDAAPDLLNACKDVSVLLNAGGIGTDAADEPWAGRLRAAIAKAEGRG